MGLEYVSIHNFETAMAAAEGTQAARRKWLKTELEIQIGEVQPNLNL
jgi:hypothetical protein